MLTTENNDDLNRQVSNNNIVYEISPVILNDESSRASQTRKS
jgi:hypothetical protein